MRGKCNQRCAHTVTTIPQVHSEVNNVGRGDWKVTVNIDPGPPVLIDKIDVQVHGAGAKDALFTRITDNLPIHRATG